jgi:hypothetical protein
MINIHQCNPHVHALALSSTETMAIRNALDLALRDEVTKVRVNPEILRLYRSLYKQFDLLCGDEARDKLLEENEEDSLP